MKIVINNDYGGFGLSDEALELYLSYKGVEFEKTINEYGRTDYWEKGHVKDGDYYLWANNIERNDPNLVRVVEELKEKTNSPYSTLKVIEIPDDIEWEINEYDGNEWVAEKHRTWS